MNNLQIIEMFKILVATMAANTETAILALNKEEEFSNLPDSVRLEVAKRLLEESLQAVRDFGLTSIEG